MLIIVHSMLIVNKNVLLLVNKYLFSNCNLLGSDLIYSLISSNSYTFCEVVRKLDILTFCKVFTVFT